MPENNKQGTGTGSLRISQDVIASIVSYAAEDVEGVASLAPVSATSPGWFIEKKTIKPVSVSVDEGVATVDLRICVNAGTNVSEVAKKVQSAVKEAVQNMAGIVVSKVNVYVAGIVFPEEKKEV